VDPFGDLHAVGARGLFTGNRGCLVDDDRTLVRHHRGNLWIICLTEYRDWSHPLDQPHRWTPLFFLDDAVGLAAGHRPCGLCRRADYLAYRAGVGAQIDRRPSATELNRRLAAERLRRGRGLDRAGHRRRWAAPAASLPDGTVVVVDRAAHLVLDGTLRRFDHDGWGRAVDAPSGNVDVLTPPTSVAALRHGFTPTLHASARPGRTARLLIEPVAQRHADGLFAALDNRLVGRHIGGPDVTTIDELRNVIARRQAGCPKQYRPERWWNWTVSLAATGEVIGRLEATTYGTWGEIAYVFGPSTWGHGYAAEGVQWMIEHLRANGMTELWAAVHPDNGASRRLLERVGFEQTATPGRNLGSYDPGDLVFRDR
jgi:RimJ/RimL family protein N-acetyltransferase